MKRMYTASYMHMLRQNAMRFQKELFVAFINETQCAFLKLQPVI